MVSIEDLNDLYLRRLLPDVDLWHGLAVFQRSVINLWSVILPYVFTIFFISFTDALYNNLLAQLLVSNDICYAMAMAMLEHRKALSSKFLDIFIAF